MEYQGRDAEEYIDNQGCQEGVTGDDAKMVINRVEEVADGPKKKEDRDVQEGVCPVHELPHPELGKALK